MSNLIRGLHLISFLALKLSMLSQNLQYTEIKGKVVDDRYHGISFVNIISKKTGLGTISHENGTFHIRVLTNDTLIFSALAYVKKSVSVNQLAYETNFVILEKNIFQLGDVNVMDIRWKEFQQQVLESKLKLEEQTIIALDGLPDPFQPRILLSPYAGNTNPLSLLLTYIKKENIRKRKQKRWRETYRKSWTDKK
ncbi:MAG: carboxypeptidase-like regulatory domain-containing protein [Bacteroidales bacterium]|nr:carboxypeptidase-like regulatory domain-containing protein [Bacteroidales bacterium]